MQELQKFRAGLGFDCIISDQISMNFKPLMKASTHYYLFGINFGETSRDATCLDGILKIRNFHSEVTRAFKRHNKIY